MTDPNSDPTIEEPPPAPVNAPDINDTELDALAADLSAIEVAMERVDDGDLDGYEAVVARLDEESSEAPDGTIPDLL